jgi:hypothetical protein
MQIATPDTQTRDRALSLALRLRKAGCHDEAQRLRIAVQHGEYLDNLRKIGLQELERMIADTERHIVVLEGRG